MTRNRILKLTGIFVLFAVCGCIYQEGTMYVAATGKPVWPEESRHLLSPKQLEGSGLEIVWQMEVPIKQGENLDRLVILGDKLCALSNTNFLTTLNRDNGSVIFSRAFADPEFPVTGIGVYEDELFAIESRRLVEMDPQTGADIRVTSLEFTAACTAVRNSGYFYIAGTDGRIRVFRAEDMVKLFEVAAPDDSPITSLVADEQFAIFTTAAGRCISFDANAPKYLWQFNADDGIVSPAAKKDDAFFFASKDTYVYRLETTEGKFMWKCPMGERLGRGPVAAAKCVYQYGAGRGLAAIDKDSGRILWWHRDAVSLIAEAGDKAYLATSLDGIIAIDFSKAPKPVGISLPGVSKYAVNTIDEKIYVADSIGRIACLKPIK